MCETLNISRRMIRVSRKTYNNRLDVATPHQYSVGQLTSLNKDLDGLYELLYSQWRSVTEEDYQVFGGQFKLVLETIKSLYHECRKAPDALGLKAETRKLGMNYSALYELNSNISNFGINAKKNAELKIALEKAGSIMHNIGQ